MRQRKRAGNLAGVLSLSPASGRLGGEQPFSLAFGNDQDAPTPVVREAAPQRGRPPKPVLYFLVRPDRRSIKIGAKVVSHGRLPHSRSLAADVRRHFCRDRQVAGAAGASMRGAWSDLRRAAAEKEVRSDAEKSAQVAVPVPPTARLTAFCRHQARFCGLPIRSKSAILVVRLAEITRKSVKIPGTNRALFTERLGDPE